MLFNCSFGRFAAEVDAEGSSLQYEVSAQWTAVVRKGPIGPVTQADLDNISALRAAAFLNAVLELHAGEGSLLHKVVVRRTDCAVRGWRDWLLEDPLVRPYKWLRADI